MTQRLVIEIEYPDGHNVAGVLKDVSEIVHRDLTRSVAPWSGSFSSNLRLAGHDYGRVWFTLREGEYHRHLVRNTTYDNIGLATLQTEAPLKDNDSVVVYRDRDTRVLYARPPVEFYDPVRFKRIDL